MGRQCHPHARTSTPFIMRSPPHLSACTFKGKRYRATPTVPYARSPQPQPHCRALGRFSAVQGTTITGGVSAAAAVLREEAVLHESRIRRISQSGAASSLGHWQGCRGESNVSASCLARSAAQGLANAQGDRLRQGCSRQGAPLQVATSGAVHHMPRLLDCRVSRGVLCAAADSVPLPPRLSRAHRRGWVGEWAVALPPHVLPHYVPQLLAHPFPCRRAVWTSRLVLLHDP
ncbi:hypothetical protein LSCM1_06238 [Leishmania martiniquensis]|uniref:Uncharacterized protein n=1 Tax=Leishmania martiniquensis TaxID=1580590 RepID=A0A836HPF8_9TRYP|nr:hypothetical protein LSCM1_06238 [Leishmania martiniquensis]